MKKYGFLTASLIFVLIVTMTLTCGAFNNINPYEENGTTPISGGLAPGDRFKISVSYSNTGAADVSFIVICGIYTGEERLDTVYVSEEFTARSGEEMSGTCEGEIPSSLPVGRRYWIKGLAFDKTTMRPLCVALSFDAANAYKTENVDGLYTGREILKNPSMEYDGAFCDSWDSRVTARIAKDTEVYKDGNASCRVYGRETWGSVSQDLTGRLTGSGKYRLRYSARSPEDNTVFNCVIRFIAAGGDISALSFQLRANTKDVWYTEDRTIDINVPSDVMRAELYIETNAANTSDFYIDACSLKPLIEYGDYIAENRIAREKKSDYERLLKKHEGESTSVIYPKESGEVLINPGKGLVYYKHSGMTEAEMTNNPPIENVGVIYRRFPWSKLEPEDGVYDFSLIDDLLEKCRTLNVKLGLGIASTMTYNSPSSYEQQTPEWLFSECGAEYIVQSVGGDNTIKVPVYTDPVFLSKYKGLTDAFAQKYNGCDDIAYVDMRCYGNWGEWHFSGLDACLEQAEKYTAEDLQRLIDLYENINLPLLTFTQLPAVQKYAMDKYNAGIRVDGTMNPYLASNHRLLSAADGKNIAVGEWFGQPSDFYPAGVYDGTEYAAGKWSEFYDYMPIMMEKTIKEGKLSYMAMGYWKPIEFYNCNTDLCQRLANKVGYWFKPMKITYSDGLFSMLVKNDGYGSLYARNGKQPCVKLAIAEADGTIAEIKTLSGVSPTEWRSGEISKIAAECDLTGLNGTRRLLLGVFTDGGLSKPDIKLGIVCSTIDGWYDLSDCETAAALSENRLYYETESYADAGYGYRSPIYAFDGKAETFWAAECVKGSYLGIDFGERVGLSQIKLVLPNGGVPSGSTVSIYARDAEGRRAVSTGVTLHSGENIIYTEKEYAEKIEIEADNTLVGELKLSEVKIIQ